MPRKVIFIFILILILGIYFRFYNINKTVSLNPDDAMAYILADRIINYNHILLIGPIVSIADINILAPTYYYFITILYFILRDELLITYVFAISGILACLLVFLLTRELFDTKTGLLAFFLITISYTIIQSSRNVWEPNLVPFFVMLAFYLLALSNRLRKIIYLYFSILFFFVSMMYISSFLLLPSFFILSIITYKNINKSLHFASIKVLLIFLFYSIIFYLPVIYYETNHNYQSFQNFTYLISGKTLYFKYNLLSFYSAFFTNFVQLIKALFLKKINYLIILLYSMFIFFTFKLSPSSFIKKKNFLILLIVLISGLFLISFYHSEHFAHRLIALYPLLFIFIAYFIRTLMNIDLLVYKLLVLFLTISFLFQYILINTNYLAYYLFVKKPYTLEIINRIALDILDISKNETVFIYTITPTDNSNYSSPTYIWTLEKLTGKKYAKLNPAGNWIEKELNNNVHKIYLICQNFEYEIEFEKNCLRYFIQKNELNEPIIKKVYPAITLYAWQTIL